MALRWLLAVLTLSIGGCTCGACARPDAADAGRTSLPSTSSSASLDAGSASLDAGLADADAGAGDAPDAATEEAAAEDHEPELDGTPTDDQLVAAYAADCHHAVNAAFSDMGETRFAPECEAQDVDQNCAPDTFGCWDQAEKCRNGCADPCGTCQAACGDTCDTCKADCDGGDCVNQCAVARLECRRACLFELQSCRSTTCSNELSKCETDAEDRVKAMCPGCDTIRACIRGNTPGDCLGNDNARECLEWCAPSY